MSKSVKIWLMVAVSLILVGLIIFGGVMVVLKWDFSELATVRYDTEEYLIDESYQNISIVTNFADVVVFPYPLEDGKSVVTCYEQVKVHHAVAVKDGTLTIEVKDTRKWYERIGIIDFKTPKIEIFVPAGEYGTLSLKSSTGDVKIPKDFKFESMDISLTTGDVECLASVSGELKIKATTGDISVENASAGALELSVSTGRVTLTDVSCAGDVEIEVSTGKSILCDVTCKNLISNGDTGDVSLKNVIASEGFSIERSTGDVNFEGCDAADIVVKTDTGDVTGSLLSEKSFDAHSDTGRVSVPRNQSGGRCKIDTDTGKILITVG